MLLDVTSLRPFFFSSVFEKMITMVTSSFAPRCSGAVKGHGRNVDGTFGQSKPAVGDFPSEEQHDCEDGRGRKVSVRSSSYPCK